MAYSLYEIDGYQDYAKPSDTLGENWYLQDVFFQTRPEVFDIDDHSTEVNDDKRNPYFRERDRDEKEDKGDHQNDDQSYTKNPNNWDEREDYLVKKTHSIIADYRLANSPTSLVIPLANTKIALSLSDLERQTSDFSVKNAPRVSKQINLLDFDRKRRLYKFQVKGMEPKSSKRGHQVNVQFGKDPKTKDIRNLDVKVSCSCPFWKYYGPDYNSNRMDYQEGKPYSNLSSPDIRDPKRSNMICKHVFAIGEYFKKWSIRNDLNTAEDVGQILQEIIRIGNAFGMDNAVKVISDIVMRLPRRDRNDLVKRIRQYEKASLKQQTRIFAQFVPLFKDILDSQEKQFLKKVKLDLNNAFNMIKREKDRVKREKDLEEKKKKREEDKKKREDKGKKPTRNKKLKKFIKKQHVQENMLNPRISKIIDLYLKETGETNGDL